MTLAQLEQRVLTLEAELQRLKSSAKQPDNADPKWVLAHAGRFENDPGFDERVRLGRKFRESLRPVRREEGNARSKSSGKNGRA
jgi:hypothetical protein